MFLVIYPPGSGHRCSKASPEALEMGRKLKYKIKQQEIRKMFYIEQECP